MAVGVAIGYHRAFNHTIVTRGALLYGGIDAAPHTPGLSAKVGQPTTRQEETYLEMHAAAFDSG